MHARRVAVGNPWPSDPDRTRTSLGATPSLGRCRIQSPPMRYLTAAGFGVLTAGATAILWVAVRFVLPVAVPFFLSRTGANQSGIGSSSAVIGSGSILLAALLGFVGGLVWMLWRR